MKHVWIATVAIALLGACGGSPSETVTTPTLPPTQSEAAAARNAKPEPAKPAPAPAPAPEASQTEVIDRAVAMFIAAAGVVNGAAGDCSKMAAELNAWLDTNDAERNAVMDELAKVPEEERVNGFNEKMAAHRDVLIAMQESVGGCVDDEAFIKAWERLEP